MFEFFKNLFRGSASRSEEENRVMRRKQPEDYYKINITESTIKVEHPKEKTTEICWDEIFEIWMINTDKGPWLPDVFIAMIGKSNSCLIPQGAKGYDEVFDIISKYEGFDFENYMNSMTRTDNAEFLVWKKK